MGSQGQCNCSPDPDPHQLAPNPGGMGQHEYKKQGLIRRECDSKPAKQKSFMFKWRINNSSERESRGRNNHSQKQRGHFGQATSPSGILVGIMKIFLESTVLSIRSHTEDPRGHYVSSWSSSPGERSLWGGALCWAPQNGSQVSVKGQCQGCPSVCPPCHPSAPPH